MGDRRLTNDQIGQLTRRANEIECGEVLDTFSFRMIQDYA